MHITIDGLIFGLWWHFFFSLFVACRLLLEREVDEGPEGALLNVLISALRSSSGPCSLLPIILCISIYAHLFFFSSFNLVVTHIFSFFFSFNLVVTHISSSFQREYSCMPWSIHHHDFRLSLVFTLFFFSFFPFINEEWDHLSHAICTYTHKYSKNKLRALYI